MAHCTWRIHRALAGERLNELRDLLATLGDTVHVVEGGPRHLEPPAAPLPGEEAGLALTTIQDARQLVRRGWNAPRLLYFHETRYHVSVWASRLVDSIPHLNRQSIFIPAGSLPSLATAVIDALTNQGDSAVFLRPDSGLKPFPGFTATSLTGGGLHADLLRQAGPLEAETMVCLARGRLIDPTEWRFWIINRQVVASSPYSWAADTLDCARPPEGAVKVAEAMAGNAWQPDVAYVVDVVFDKEDAKFYLNELNAASTSGLYAVPLQQLVAPLRAAMLDEARGLLSIED